MAKKHTVTARDKWFIDKCMKDPVAQEPFKVGDTIVICAKCKTAHHESSWIMNSNKCCSMGCNHSSQLSFKRFSPVYFQPKLTRSSHFNVIAEKIPFGERQKLFNIYPMANIITVIIPILIIVTLLYSLQSEVVPMYKVTNQLLTIQDRYTILGNEGNDKFQKMCEKVRSINVEFGEMDYKSKMVISSFDGIKPKFVAVETGFKFSKVISNIQLTSSHVGKKLNCCFSLTSEFFNKLFDS